MSSPPAQPIVWIIDNEQWPRAGLRAELIERGCEVIGFTTIVEAVIVLQVTREPKPNLIVLELRGQEWRREVLSALVQSGIPIIILGGAIELNDPLIGEFNWAAVIKRPFTIGAVADKVIELLEQP